MWLTLVELRKSNLISSYRFPSLESRGYLGLRLSRELGEPVEQDLVTVIDYIALHFTQKWMNLASQKS